MTTIHKVGVGGLVVSSTASRNITEKRNLIKKVRFCKCNYALKLFTLFAPQDEISFQTHKGEVFKIKPVFFFCVRSGDDERNIMCFVETVWLQKDFITTQITIEQGHSYS